MSNGNATEMREALEVVVKVGYPHNFQREAPHIRGYCYEITTAIEKCFAALAAPPHNCDVGTVEEQSRRMDAEYCTVQKSCYESPSGRQCPLYKAGVDCRLIWAQMPYKKGGVK